MANTSTVLYAKNINEHVYPASTIKVLTGLIAVENASMDENVYFSDYAVSLPEGYTTLPAYSGEVMPLWDCMRGMLVMSANDCAKAVAEHVGGSSTEFANLMNLRANELGCTESQFVTAYGGYDPDHYSTAHDMYLITKAAFENEMVASLAHMHDCVLSATNVSGERYIYSKNQLYNPSSYYYDEHVVASKSGNLDSGRCLVTRADFGGGEFYIICMESVEYMGVFDDTRAILNYIYENIDVESMLETNVKTQETESDISTEPELDGRSQEPSYEQIPEMDSPSLEEIKENISAENTYDSEPVFLTNELTDVLIEEQKEYHCLGRTAYIIML